MKIQKMQTTKILLAIAILISHLPLATPVRAARPRAASATLAASPFAAPLPQESPTPVASPSATPTPDAELEEAKRAALLAEEKKKKEVAEKDAANAQNERLKAAIQPLGEPKNVTIPTGSVQTDAAGWAESQALAQEGARQITRRLSDFLCNKPMNVRGNPLTINTLVIYNANDVTAVEVYDSMVKQLEYLEQEFENKHGEVPPLLAKTNPNTTGPQTDSQAMGLVETALALPGIATSLTKSVAELVNLFRTDTTFVNQSVVINEDTVVSYLADYLSSAPFKIDETHVEDCAQKFDIYYPLYMPSKPASDTACPKSKSINSIVTSISGKKNRANLDVSTLADRIKLLTDLEAAVKTRKDKEKAKAGKVKELGEKQTALNNPKLSKAQKKKLGEEIKTLNGAIKTLEGDITEANKKIKETYEKAEQGQAQVELIVSNSEKFEEWKRLLTKLKTETETLITSTEQFLTKLNTPDETTKLTALARLLRAERLQCILSADTTYTLRVVVTANGTTKIKKNIFVDAKVRHSARAGLVYQLFDNFGRVVKGSSMQCYIDYQSARDVRDAVSGEGAPVKCSTPEPKSSKVARSGAEKDKDNDKAAQ